MKKPIVWSEKVCPFCEGANPASNYVRGTRWSYFYCRVIPFHGYVCDNDIELLEKVRILASRPIQNGEYL